MRINYEHSPVRAAATVEFWNYDFDAAATSANVGAVRLAIADDAQALFATFTQQWRYCLGRTVVGHTHDSDDTELYSLLGFDREVQRRLVVNSSVIACVVPCVLIVKLSVISVRRNAP
jgi:hypothetical protein